MRALALPLDGLPAAFGARVDRFRFGQTDIGGRRAAGGTDSISRRIAPAI
jgi:hypothetical protein